ncbi:hypothetical protein ALC57_02628 [Trachymyrmex cornetzi]|uniref:Endonuclease/exonuclease/phosphatase domain-containing protein n=1 Tax=Trachymyrmex cornetzi TaxID=471704 RepID=A0A151JNM0_9HYME|nr:hypothetical protein ALC57_02628 [Trachymyrmex cornetzi]
MGSIEEKSRIMRNKWKLKGRDIWIEEDLTWKERKMRWMIRRVLAKEGGRAKIGQGGYGEKGYGESGMKKGRERRGEEKVVRIVFWNVAGVGNKDREFWDNLKRWDATVLIETWVEGKREKKLRERLPDGYVWRIQNAKRRNKKGRAMGGMIMGIRRELYVGERGRREMEGMMTGVINVGESRVRVMRVYINMDLQSKLEGMTEWMEGREEGVKTVIITEEIEGEEVEERRSKNSKVNKEGRKLVGFIREKGDEQGNWTYTGGRGESVIDYVLMDEEAREQIECMEVGDAIESDHHPLIVAWRGGKGCGMRKEGGFLEVEWREGSGEENMKETEERLREVLGSIEKERGKERKGRGWWDKECIEKKKMVRRILRGWRKGSRNGEEYRREKREYKELCEYGVEIWGWKEREVESLQERYLRWMLGVERRTPGYLVREELQREKLRAKTGKRAWAFEERLRRGVGVEGWEREREQYFVERGVVVDRGVRGRGRERLILRRYKKGIGKCRGWKDGKRLGSRDIIGGMDG